jgi:hypothetical protein
MRRWTSWLYLLAGVAAIFVAVSSVAAAVRQGSWEPIIAMGWLPAVIVATWPGNDRRRCLPRRSGQAG